MKPTAFLLAARCSLGGVLPNRGARLTGLMPAHNGAGHSHSCERDNMAEVLRQLGCQTVAFGKVAHGMKDIERHGSTR